MLLHSPEFVQPFYNILLSLGPITVLGVVPYFIKNSFVRFAKISLFWIVLTAIVVLISSTEKCSGLLCFEWGEPIALVSTVSLLLFSLGYAYYKR